MSLSLILITYTSISCSPPAPPDSPSRRLDHLARFAKPTTSGQKFQRCLFSPLSTCLTELTTFIGGCPAGITCTFTSAADHLLRGGATPTLPPSPPAIPAGQLGWRCSAAAENWSTPAGRLDLKFGPYTYAAYRTGACRSRNTKCRHVWLRVERSSLRKRGEGCMPSLNCGRHHQRARHMPGRMHGLWRELHNDDCHARGFVGGRGGCDVRRSERSSGRLNRYGRAGSGGALLCFPHDRTHHQHGLASAPAVAVAPDAAAAAANASTPDSAPFSDAASVAPAAPSKLSSPLSSIYSTSSQCAS